MYRIMIDLFDKFVGTFGGGRSKSFGYCTLLDAGLEEAYGWGDPISMDQVVAGDVGVHD